MTSAEYQQLVDSLDRQFTEVGHRFTEIGHRFTGMDRRFDEVDLRVTALRQDMLGHFDTIYHRFERLEQEYHAIT
jgi:bisphosphoglycerate-independent phosphoglycerate mutase (AlkP superfamily)